MSRILIVDSTNNFIRNYTIVPTLDTHGRPTGGWVGFLKSLRSFIEKCKPTKVVLVWDGPGGSQRRREVVKEYKEGRRPVKLNRNFDFEFVNVEENKIWQIKRLQEYLSDFPVHQCIVDNIEADDVIAYLCSHYQEDEKVIVSTDKDFYQMVDSKTIIFTPTKKEFVTSAKLVEEYGIHPTNFAVARAIVGDPSDNLKGVNSIGYKSLVKLFPNVVNSQKVELNQIFEECSQNSESNEKYKRIVENRELIIKNLQLMDLRNAIISPQSVRKIKQSLEQKVIFNVSSFKMKLLEDGITTFNDNFIESFRFLS
jgi:5'-3' exonuclease